MPTLADTARAFLALHRPGDPVVLPTVWDAWSANIAADNGFAGLTVGSHPVADSIGRADNEGMTFDELLTRVAQITAAVDLPVSVDIESGYGLPAQRLIDGLLSVGAVGLNIEDTVHGEGGRSRSDAEHADLVAALRQAADGAGVPVVVNARTDLFLKKIGDESDRFERVVRRLTLCAEAGANVLYPVSREHTADDWARLAAALPLPVNAIASPESERLDHFAPLGIGRISFGPRWQAALGAVAADMLAGWR